MRMYTRPIKSLLAGIMIAVVMVTVTGISSAQADTFGIWERKALVGFNMTQGNSDTVNYHVSLTGKKDEEGQYLMVGLDSNYGETEGSRTTDNSEGYGKFQRQFSDINYGSLWASLATDAANDTDYRFIISPAYGQFFIKTDQEKLKVDLGPSYTREKVGTTRDTIFSVRLSEQYDRVLTESTTMWQKAEFLPDLEDSEFLLNAEAGLETTLTTDLNFRGVFKNRFNSSPPGTKKKNDFALISSVSYDF